MKVQLTLDIIDKSYQPINMHRQFGLIVPTTAHITQGDYIRLREYVIPSGTQKGLVKNYTGRDKLIQCTHIITGPKAGLFGGYQLVSFLYV